MLGVGPVRWPYPGAVADNTRVPLNRTERLLAFVVASVGGLSIVAILAMLIARMNAVNTGKGIWLTVTVLPGIGLPVALILLIVFIVLTTVRRARLARDAAE